MNENNISGTLESVVINGSVYQLGKDASTSVAAAVAAAKSVVAAASNDYITITPSTDANDGHAIYTIGTTGIDIAISSAIAAVVGNSDEAFDTLKEISDWITADTTGAAAILADVANKANKVDSATNGNFAGLDANGDLTDSGYNAARFQIAGSYKTTQTAVADPTASGNSVSFIDTISQDSNGVIAPTKKTIPNAAASTSGVGGTAGLMSAADKEKLDSINTSTLLTQSDVPNWVTNGSKPSYVYDEIGYEVTTVSTSGAVSLIGTHPLYEITLTGNVSSVTLSTNPSVGHSCHVIFANQTASDLTVSMTHDSTNRICAGGTDPDPLEVPAGGYAEVDFLNTNGRVYVNCVQ